jgi:hypothetical protein
MLPEITPRKIPTTLRTAPTEGTQTLSNGETLPARGLCAAIESLCLFYFQLKRVLPPGPLWKEFVPEFGLILGPFPWSVVFGRQQYP